MKPLRHIFNVFARIFDIHLYKVLQQEIGWNSDIRVGFFTLGIKVMVALASSKKLTSNKEALDGQAHTCSPTAFQADLKK
jgi:hypothetical protein